MKFKDIENKSKTELNELLNDLKAESFTLGWKNKTQQLDQTHKIKLVRRDIAKVLTALKQIELKESLENHQDKKNNKSLKTATKKPISKKEGNK